MSADSAGLSDAVVAELNPAEPEPRPEAAPEEAGDEGAE